VQYDASINGLNVGPTYDITISKMDGLTGSPPVRTNLVNRLGYHGAFYGRDLYGPRTVTLTLNIRPNRTNSGSTLDSLSEQLERALVAQQAGTLQLILNGGKRVLNCRPLNWDLPRTTDMAADRWGKATVQLVAADPFIYDASESLLSLPCYSPGLGGWTIPWTFPWTFTPTPSGSPGTAFAVNNGSIETGPWFRVYGPFNIGFGLRNLSTGALLQVGMVMQSSDWVDVDMNQETILFQSFSNRRSSVIFGTDFWKLPPGGSTVRLETLGATGGSAQMHYRSAYLALRA